MAEEEDLEIVDVENYSSNKAKTYNPQQIIMEQISLCLKNGSTDTDDTGGWEERLTKDGQIIRTYRPDLRKIFINSVKALMYFVHRDFKDHEDYNKKINDNLKLLKERKNYWLEQEWNWWNSLNNAQKNQMYREGKQVEKGFFNKKLNFDNFYFDEELEIYWKIFELISDFIKDKMHDYEEEYYTG